MAAMEPIKIPLVIIPPDYLPGDAVTVVAFGLNYEGGVVEITWDGLRWYYFTEYAHDGEIKSRRFDGSQLRAKR